jgi:hypothetical protein
MLRDLRNLRVRGTFFLGAKRRFTGALVLIPIVLVALVAAARAQEPFPASQLHFTAIFGQRGGEKAVYCLLGSGFFRTPRSGEEDALIKAFAADHPGAQAIPVTLTVPSIVATGPRVPMFFVWIEDGDASLNVMLVREGAFPGGVMIDAVQMANSGMPQPKEEDRPRRLIDDGRYQSFLQRVMAAEAAAKAERKGVWSEEYQKQFGPDDPDRP